MRNLLKVWIKVNEAASVIMLAGIFCTFLLQIFSRYILAEPFGWTLEVCLTLWVWIIFWNTAFVVKYDEHVTFDILYYAVREKIRKIFALIIALSIVVVFLIALYPTWDFIDFLKIKKSTYLQVPMRTVFSVYMLFMIATIVIYLMRVVRIVRFGLIDDKPPHIIPAGNIEKRAFNSN